MKREYDPVSKHVRAPIRFGISLQKDYLITDSQHLSETLHLLENDSNKFTSDVHST